MPKKLDYLYVKKSFDNEGYVLLSKEYENNTQRLHYVCPNGHTHYTTWSNWNHSKKFRCPYCYGNARYKIEDIKKLFVKEGYILMSSVYKNINSKLHFVCNKGHHGTISLNNWNQGHRCFKCSYDHRARILKKDLIEVKSLFEKEGYLLLSTTYVNSKTKLLYKCKCNHINSMTLDCWVQGNRCPTCAYIGFFGQNNSQWKGGISKEPYCQEWTKEYKQDIKNRDGNKCLNPYCDSKNSNDLTVHHINYDKKDCHPENLITVCRSCNSRANTDRRWHKSWYKTVLNKRYGYKY